MPAPDPHVENTCIGRTGTAVFNCNWTAAEASDLTSFTIVDVGSDLAGIYENERMGVEKLDWTCGEDVEAVVCFDSLGSDNTIHVIPSNSTQGSFRFDDEPSGCRTDPDRDNPGSIVVSTTGAADGSRLWMRISYKVKGAHKPQGTLS